jgi:ribosomal protein S18 acetylase RimI-like enzyme
MRSLLRPARAADLADLAQLARETYAAAFAHTFTVAGDLQAHLDDNMSDAAVAEWIADQEVTLADLDGRVVAFAQFGPTPAGSYGGFPAEGEPAVHRLYVVRDLIGQGLGGTLLVHALSAMNAADRDVYLDVWEGNHGARRLYARHGFEDLGRVGLATASGAGAGYDIVMVRRRAPL